MDKLIKMTKSQKLSLYEMGVTSRARVFGGPRWLVAGGNAKAVDAVERPARSWARSASPSQCLRTFRRTFDNTAAPKMIPAAGKAHPITHNSVTC